MALITRVNARGHTEYLTQWNEKWQVYSLIGGHREGGESFHECCNREVEEELGLQRDIGFAVSKVPVAPTLEYMMYSKRVGEETRYRMQMFRVEICSARERDLIDANPLNRWFSKSEIDNRLVSNGRPVSEQVSRVLAAWGVLEG